MAPTSLRARLLLAFALVAAVPLVVTELVAARLLRREFAARTARDLEASARLVERRFAAESVRVERAVEAAAGQYALRAAVFAYALEGGSRQSDLIAAVAAAAAAHGLGLLAVYREDGTLVATAQEPERFDVGDAAHALLARHPGAAVLAPEEGVAVRGLALRVARPLEAPAEGYLLAGGALVDEVFRGHLAASESLAVVVVSGGEAETAVTAAGREADPVLGAAPRPLHPGAARVALARERWQVREAELPGVVRARGVGLLVATSTLPLRAQLAQLERAFALLLVLGLGLAVGLASVISRRWTDPLLGLVHGLDRVARGDLEHQLPGGERGDEIGTLVRAFHAMTRDLAESREKLLGAERVAAWREVARRLAHEIKNPLSPISLSMETLRRAHAAGRPDFPEFLRESTATVLEEVERMRRIVQEFSDFARLPPPRLIEESFHEVVRGVAALHGGLDRHRIELDLEPGEGRLAFDPDQMNRLLVNLVKNAIEAQPDRGWVRITTRGDRGRGRFVVTVEDGGPGVEASLARVLFQPYASGKPGGTGLGLAISHRIAEEHGGSLRCLNPGEPRARFALELPLGGMPAATSDAGPGPGKETDVRA